MWLDSKAVNCPQKWGNFIDAITTLLEAGADPNARDKYDYAPLHWAAIDGHAKVVEALLKAGADPMARNTFGKLPFDYAKDNDRLKGTDVYWKLHEARFP